MLSARQADLDLILAQAGPEGIHCWFKTRLTRRPKDEAKLAERAFRSLRSQFPAEAAIYAERLLRLDPSPTLIRSIFNVFVKLGDLNRAQVIAERAGNPPAWKEKIECIAAELRLLKNGLPWPKHVSAPAYSPIPRRVLYVLRRSLPYSSVGYAIRSQGLAKAIRHVGYDLHCVTQLGYPWDEKNFDEGCLVDIVEHIDGVPYIRLPSVIYSYRNMPPLDQLIAHAAERICALAMILRPSLLHAASNFVCGSAGVLAAKRLGLPSVYEVRGLIEVTQRSKLPYRRNSDLDLMHERMEAEVAREASAVFAITGAVKAELVRRGVPDEKISVVPNGVDSDKWRPLAKDRELEQRLGLVGKTVIGYLGSLTPYEGLDLLFHAARRLKDRSVAPFAVLVVGDGESFEQLRSLAAEIDLGESVVFTGRVPHDDVARYYSLVDIAPFPRKGLEVCEMVSPLKPFEAMSMQKAVVSSDVAALAEIVSHEVTGLLHRKDDIEDLTGCLEHLLSSPELRSRLGAQAHDWVRANRDWTVVARRAADTYEMLAG